jgi:hypothetical protein
LRHRLDWVSLKKQWQGIGCLIDDLIDRLLVASARFGKYVPRYFTGVARMADTDSQAMKILFPPKRGNDVPEPIVPPMATTLLEARLPRGDIQFVMGDKNFIGWYPKKVSCCSD